jgi:Uma2 family endonuclease
MVEQLRPDLFTDDPARNETVVAEGVSFENFLEFFAEKHAEWLMGKVILIVTNNTLHQRIQMFLGTLLNLFLGYKSLGQILSAGVSMYISDNQPARQPDLLVILNEHRDRIKAQYIAGPADIAIEIVSPESSKRDRGDKVDEYEAAGVQEYWLFDPLRRDAVIYELGVEGRYHVRPLDKHGRVTSGVLPGFALDPALLWQDEHPAGPEMVALVEQMTSDAG